jgi:putative hydrolase of HD superfamily
MRKRPHNLCTFSPWVTQAAKYGGMTDICQTINLPAIDRDRLSRILSFLQAAEQLKDTLRSGTTRSGRPESTAEHSWRLALMVLLFENELDGIDVPKLLKLCLVHDLGEAISGDVPAPLQTPGDDRQDRERRDFRTLCDPLPGDISAELLTLFDEYAAAATPEAQLAKAFDKLETMLQHVLMPLREADFYAFNLGYGRDRTEVFPLTRQIREIVDAKTRSFMKQAHSEPA